MTLVLRLVELRSRGNLQLERNSGEAALLGVHARLGGFGADMLIKTPINPRVPGDIGLTAAMNDVPECFILSLGLPNSPTRCIYYDGVTPHNNRSRG